MANADSFPIGYIAWANASGTVAPGWAWSTAILPGLEDASLYNDININIPIDLSDNATVRTTLISGYLCPSDRRTGTFMTLSTLVGGTIEARTISYAANQGVDGSSPGNGLFVPNKSIRSKDIKDGLSTTLACGERGSFVAQNSWAGALSDGRGGDQVLARILFPASVDTVPSPATFSSTHPGVVNFLMADGSARAVKTSVDPAVYRALATRSGREIVDSNNY
jgi:prepilin-type processing-associated H-X9-DG protein